LPKFPGGVCQFFFVFCGIFFFSPQPGKTQPGKKIARAEEEEEE
jgi:hypothetical protein